MLHRGPSRRYFCPEWLTERRMLVDDVANRRILAKNACLPRQVLDGEEVPSCEHGTLLLKRYKTRQERRWEAQDLSTTVLYLGGAPIYIWSDVAKRSSRCGLCRDTITAGDERFAFDTASKPQQRTRRYYHRACLIDSLLGGTPGKGCPGCSAKREDNEFRAYKKMVAKRYAAG